MSMTTEGSTHGDYRDWRNEQDQSGGIIPAISPDAIEVGAQMAIFGIDSKRLSSPMQIIGKKDPRSSEPNTWTYFDASSAIDALSANTDPRKIPPDQLASLKEKVPSRVELIARLEYDKGTTTVQKDPKVKGNRPIIYRIQLTGDGSQSRGVTAFIATERSRDGKKTYAALLTLALNGDVEATLGKFERVGYAKRDQEKGKSKQRSRGRN